MRRPHIGADMTTCMKLFLDFDRTLYDLDSMFEETLAIWARFGVDRVAWSDAKNGFARGSGEQGPCYTIAEHARRTGRLDDAACRDLEGRMKELWKDGRRYVYPGVSDFLVSAKGKGWGLHLLTFGSADMQIPKIEGSGLVSYLDSIIVTQRDKWAEIESRVSGDEAVMFVDDGKDYFADSSRFPLWGGAHLHRDAVRCDCRAVMHISRLGELLDLRP